MARYAYVNGRYVDHRDASVHIEDRGYQLADGVYEVVGVRGGKLIDETPHVDRLERKRQAASLDPRNVEHLVDQPEQMPPGGQDVRQAVALLGVEGVHLEHLAEAQDRIERRSELVAHPGQELALRPVSTIGFLFRWSTLRDLSL